MLPPYDRYPLLAVKTVAVTPDAQVNVELEIPQGPLEDFNVKPEPVSLESAFSQELAQDCTLPEAVAVYVAHVPEVYQVPALIKHPF